MSEYSFDIVRYLTDDELVELADACFPSLQQLSERYAPEVDLSDGFPSQPEYLDLVRTGWLLDDANDRPDHQTVVNGLGFAFGLLVAELSDLRWGYARDEYGEFLALLRTNEQGARYSVPVFTYVDKRETVQDAEVFTNFFRHAPPHMLREKEN